MATRTITHLYDTYEAASEAVSALERAGIPSADISIVGRHSDGTTATDPGDVSAHDSVAGAAHRVDPYAHSDALDRPVTAADAPVIDETDRPSAAAGTGATLGTVIGGGAGLLAGIGALAIPGLGPVVAAGWLIATLTGAGAGAAAGGLLGSLTGSGVNEADAHVYAEGVRRGGTLVTVRVDDAQAAEVEQILGGTNRVDLAERGASYRAGGWSQFDPAAPTATSAAVTGAPLGATSTALGSEAERLRDRSSAI